MLSLAYSLSASWILHYFLLACPNRSGRYHSPKGGILNLPLNLEVKSKLLGSGRGQFECYQSENCFIPRFPASQMIVLSGYYVKGSYQSDLLSPFMFLNEGYGGFSALYWTPWHQLELCIFLGTLKIRPSLGTQTEFKYFFNSDLILCRN